MSNTKPMESVDRGKERVVALLDMDCFYVQVEQKSNPALKGKPCAVVQYKTWQGGGIIAVSYEARAYGVTRGMRGVEAKKKCPQLELARIPEAHGKANLSKYREASVQVISVMSRFAVIERASIDEAFVDLTVAARQRVRQMQGLQVDPELLKSTFVEGFSVLSPPQQSEDTTTLREEERRAGVQAWLASLPPDCDEDSPGLQLTAGALIVEEMRAAVEAETGYRCSAGISHNKVLAKLSCGLNKPNRQTLLPLCSVPQLFDTLPIGKIRNLGGKLGESITQLLKIEYMGQLRTFSEVRLQAEFGEKTGSWLFDLCRGVDFEPVRPRQLPKTIGCSKNFLGTEALSSCDQVKHWLLQLATELEERLGKDKEQNQRLAKQLSVGVRLEGNGKSSGFSRCCTLTQYQAQRIARDAFALISGFNSAGSHQAAWSPAVTGLNLSAGKFSEPPADSAKSISQFLSDDSRSCQVAVPSSPSRGGVPTRGCAVSPGQAARDSAGWIRPRASSITSFFKQTAFHPATVSSPATQTPSVRGEQDHVTPGGTFPLSPLFFKSRALAAPLTETQTPPLARTHSPGALIQCLKCGEHKDPWEMAEHEDFHFALDLQKTLSVPPSRAASPRPAASSTTQLKKKASTQLVPGGKRPRVGSRQTLYSYFKKAAC